MASTLAERMRAARDAKGLGTNALDRLANVAKGNTSRVESGGRKQLGADVVARYAVALGVAHEWLATGLGPRQPPSPEAIPVGTSLPVLRAVLTLLAGDTDPALVRSFWETASAVAGAEDVPAIEWAARFVMAWMSANKPSAPKTKIVLDPNHGKRRPMDKAIADLVAGEPKVKTLDE